MSGEATEVSEDVYAYIQPDGTWYLNNTGFLVALHSRAERSADRARQRHLRLHRAATAPEGERDGDQLRRHALRRADPARRRGDRRNRLVEVAGRGRAVHRSAVLLPGRPRREEGRARHHDRRIAG